MNIEIDSLDVIQQLKKDDIIFHPETDETFRITQTGDDYFILAQEIEHRAMRLIYHSRLISEKWRIIKSNIQTESFTKDVPPAQAQR